MVIDEFQNYMPEQINLLNTCLDQQTKSVIYVGDIAQQIIPGALRTWDSVGLQMNAEREVKLHKVYRNTKQILSYIKSLGYKVEIPDQIKEGREVCEQILNSEKEIISYIENLVKTKQGIIGVISNEVKSLQDYFKNEKRIHVTTMAGSQGVEFDTVCIVGIDKDFFEIKDQENLEERKRIQKDLLYVALTRAISELHIVGSSKLSTIASKSL